MGLPQTRCTACEPALIRHRRRNPHGRGVHMKLPKQRSSTHTHPPKHTAGQQALPAAHAVHRYTNDAACCNQTVRSVLAAADAATCNVVSHPVNFRCNQCHDADATVLNWLLERIPAALWHGNLGNRSRNSLSHAMPPVLSHFPRKAQGLNVGPAWLETWDQASHACSWERHMAKAMPIEIEHASAQRASMPDMPQLLECKGPCALQTQLAHLASGETAMTSAVSPLPGC